MWVCLYRLVGGATGLVSVVAVAALRTTHTAEPTTTAHTEARTEHKIRYHPLINITDEERLYIYKASIPDRPLDSLPHLPCTVCGLCGGVVPGLVGGWLGLVVRLGGGSTRTTTTHTHARLVRQTIVLIRFA